MATSCGASPLPVCPAGTRAAGGEPPKFWAAWCEKRDGTRHGPIVGFNEDGSKLYQGAYLEGRYDGRFVGFDYDGDEIGSFQIRRGTGPWKLWHASGAVAQTGTYKDGKKEGTWVSFYENGKKSQEGQFESDLEVGLFRWWAPDGQPTSEVTYERGRYHGVQKTFDEKGALLEEAEYVHGKRTRLTRWEAGAVVSNETFPLPEPPSGPAVTRKHPGIEERWQACSAHHDCEVFETACCACGAKDYVSASFVFAADVRHALAKERNCSSPCPAQECVAVRARCDEGRCVTVED